jgi:hypothetical protein
VVVGFLMDGGECLTGQGQWRSGKNTAAAMARRSSSPEQEWDDALMHETQRGMALNETKAMGILTRVFSRWRGWLEPSARRRPVFFLLR